MLVFASFLVLLVASLFLVMSRKEEKSQATQRRKKAKSAAPKNASLGTSPLEPAVQESEAHVEDADEALGLKSKDESVEPLYEGSKLEHIVLHLMAPAKMPYSGYELLQALLANGMRFGKMNIFHRHESKNGQGCVLFSLASANKPGTFDLPNMGGYSCPGLTLFMSVDGLSDPLHAFDVMLDTAQQLRDDLGGDLWDINHQPLNSDKIDLLRKQLGYTRRQEKAPAFSLE